MLVTHRSTRCVFNGSSVLMPSSCCQDDPPAMDFVTAAANLRMHIFSMNMKSRFDVKCKLPRGRKPVFWNFFFFLFYPVNKSVFIVHICLLVNGRGSLVVLFVSAMAGNIIPAIATTNAVIAGLIVLEGLKILSGQLESCRTVSSRTKRHGWI